MKINYRFKTIVGIFLILIGIIINLTIHLRLVISTVIYLFLFFFGFQLISIGYKEKKGKKVLNDELFKWIECKSALNGMISGYITSLILLAIIEFNSDLLSKKDILLTILGAMILVFFCSYIYYLKIKKNKGY